jgi:hypothetical protein
MRVSFLLDEVDGRKGGIEMSTLTIRLPNDQHERLKALASAHGVSLNKLFEELSARALAEFDAEARFRPAQGSERRRLGVFDHLDRAHKG